MSAARLSGALLLVIAGAALGLERSARVKRRVRLLSALGAALGVMAEEISMLRTPLPELFAQLAGRAGPELREFFATLSEPDERLLSGKWGECVDALPLLPEERETLRSLSLSLGRYDAGSQCAQIELVRAQIERLAQEARIERDGKAKTYLGLGLSLGAMAAVILL